MIANGAVPAEKMLYTVDEFEALLRLPENRDRRLELIYGEMHEKMPTEKHGMLAVIIATFFLLFAEPRKLGYPSVETRHRMPGDKHNDRRPDVSFRRATSPVVEEGAVPQMPDLAVEIQSPDDAPREMREKAAYYLQNGTKIVWLVYPTLKQVEVCTLTEQGTMDIEIVNLDGMLSGGDVLPGFTLAVKDIFERDIFKQNNE